MKKHKNYIEIEVENIIGQKKVVKGCITEVSGDEIYIRTDDGREIALAYSD